MMQILDCVQGDDEWRLARAGIPTASMFKTVLASGKKGEDSLTRAKYMRQLAGERITGIPMETYSNHYMERGQLMEEEARNAYAFLTNADPQRVGFIRNGEKGCSPDSLVGTNGMLEIKTALPDILIDKLLKGGFPPEHKAQTQGNLWVAEREWIDLTIYFTKMPPFIVRAYRDEVYIRDLERAVAEFNAELEEIVQRVRAYSGAELVAA